jgi:hypothetical protein
MNRNKKIDALAEGTMEICIKVLVRKDTAAQAMSELLELAEARPDYVTSVGAYCEPPESDDLEHVADDVPDERMAGLA